MKPASSLFTNGTRLRHAQASQASARAHADDVRRTKSPPRETGRALRPASIDHVHGGTAGDAARELAYARPVKTRLRPILRTASRLLRACGSRGLGPGTKNCA